MLRREGHEKGQDEEKLRHDVIIGECRRCAELRVSRSARARAEFLARRARDGGARDGSIRAEPADGRRRVLGVVPYERMSGWSSKA